MFKDLVSDLKTEELESIRVTERLEFGGDDRRIEKLSLFSLAALSGDFATVKFLLLEKELPIPQYDR